MPTAPKEPSLVIAETTSPPSPAAFFDDHVKKNVPLVLRSAAAQWRAMHWTGESLAAAHGHEPVKVAPLEVAGPHAHLDKWLESSSDWAHHEQEYCCDAHQLLVVSALRVKMRLHTFLKKLRQGGCGATFYADGAGNLEHSFSFLRGDFAPPSFASKLQLKRVDLWIGGDSVSRMHYDNLDNVFAQVVGSKTFVLARPEQGAALQGGKRLRKAARLYTHPGQFAREGGGVLHETVLNYLGAERPKERLPTVSVTLNPGDVLYLPFGWWHEVHAHPDESKGRLCASVAHFYKPYFCRLGGKEQMSLGPMMVNPVYDDDQPDEQSVQAAAAGMTAAVSESALGTTPGLNILLVSAAVAAAVSVLTLRWVRS